MPLVLALAALALALWTARVEAAAESPYPLARTIPYRAGMAVLARDAAERAAASGEIAIPIALRPGETLGQVFDDLGLGAADAAALSTELARYADLRRLRPSDSFTAARLPDGSVTRFELTIEGSGTALVRRDGGVWRGSWRAFRREIRVRSLRGRLEGSLESSVREAGGAAMLAYLLADVFQWDLDFNRDLRVGDEFEALYEEVFLDGRLASLGSVLAARYTNLGRTLEAYRYGDSGAYYDGEGRPMRKMFLRSPLRFSRITSNFSQRRFHPVLKKYRPHYGVDYGAPTGTPARVTANGVVTFAGWDRGGGRTVKVRHPNGYLTAYLHLSRFAKEARVGRRVTQGQVIGYVGSTGLATGPHLDYRVQRDGRWINPLSLRSLPTEPLPESELPRFMARRDLCRTALAGEGPPPPPLEPREAGRVATLDEAGEERPVLGSS